MNIFVFIILELLAFFILAHPAESGMDARIMVVIPEYHLESKDSGRIYIARPRQTALPGPRRRTPDPAGETEVIKSLLAAGFFVVDQKQTETIRYSDQINATINGQKDLAILLGQQFNADIIITGEAISQSTGNSFQGLFSSRSRIEVKAIDLKTGRILFTDGVYASAIDRSETISEKTALQKAGKKIGEILGDRLYKDYNKPSKNIQLIVTGLPFKKFLSYKASVLSSIKGLTIIEPVSFVKEQCFIVVQTNNNIEKLAGSIATQESQIFFSEIITISQNSITIAVHDKKN